MIGHCMHQHNQLYVWPSGPEGVRGTIAPPPHLQILVNMLPYFHQGGRSMPITLQLAPTGFSDLPTALVCFGGNLSMCLLLFPFTIDYCPDQKQKVSQTQNTIHVFLPFFIINSLIYISLNNSQNILAKKKFSMYQF